jgi:hypothetical protein
LAVALSSTVFATTLHAQDFKDEAGDRLTGRRTLPTIFPKAARFSMMFGIPLWSFVLSCVWKIDALSTAMLVAYGALVGTRFAMYRTVSADKQSCKFYSVSRKITEGYDIEVELTLELLSDVVLALSPASRLLALFLWSLKKCLELKPLL